MPSASSSMAWARTMSRMVTTGKLQPVGLARRRIDVARSRRPHAAADHIGADDEEPVGVDRLAGTDDDVPPAGLARHRVSAGDELIAGERMRDEHRVRALGVQRAVGHVGDGERRKLLARIQDQRIGRAQAAAPGPDLRRAPLTGAGSAGEQLRSNTSSKRGRVLNLMLRPVNDRGKPPALGPGRNLEHRAGDAVIVHQPI